ncbi:hypothetical protein [Petrimonas mucosa]|jgi:hypothetical protein|uniref:hypothetical protein n=1 Tax=Petrimonas mucosa TaxID=1642646 RepID=UPI0017714124|nr:hypothetical protein [Petrimonas mucosa]HHT29859.1 hypothetical protein [Petrimonas mucosa]
MEVKRYSKTDEELLFDMLVDEGDDLSDYHGLAGRGKYIKALESSITYIAYDKTILCGYARCREDDGFSLLLSIFSVSASRLPHHTIHFALDIRSWEHIEGLFIW